MNISPLLPAQSLLNETCAEHTDCPCNAQQNNDNCTDFISMLRCEESSRSPSPKSTPLNARSIEISEVVDTQYMAHTVLSTIRDFLSNGITTKKHALDEGWYFGKVQDETDESLLKLSSLCL